MEAIYDVGTEGLRDPHGVQLPPCIVMEKGESLQELLERAAPGRVTSLSVRFLLPSRLPSVYKYHITKFHCLCQCWYSCTEEFSEYFLARVHSTMLSRGVVTFHFTGYRCAQRSE